MRPIKIILNNNLPKKTEKSKNMLSGKFAQMDNDRYVCVLRGLRLFLDYKV